MQGLPFLTLVTRDERGGSYLASTLKESSVVHWWEAGSVMVRFAERESVVRSRDSGGCCVADFLEAGMYTWSLFLT